jgi:hypothetical protein
MFSRVPRVCRVCKTRLTIRFEIEFKERRFLVARARCIKCGAVYEAMREMPIPISSWGLGVLEASIVER